MAVVTTKSVTITNRDAVPSVINDARLERAVSKGFHGKVTAVNGDSIGSKYIIAQVPSTAFIQQLLLTTAALTSGAANVGVYYPTNKDGTAGAAIAATLFASAQSVASALSNAEITNQSGNYTLAKQEQPLWQAAGLTSDPGGFLDIVITLTAALTAGGDIGMVGWYCDNGA
jgi:hypothetical protein